MRLVRSVHDNNIFAYTVDCENRRLTLHTVSHRGEAPAYTDIVFEDVVAHKFENVLSGNIILCIDEVAAKTIVGCEAALFAESWKYGWPPIEYNGGPDVLISALQNQGILGFEISSSYGLSGWVLAKRCDVLDASAGK